MKVCVVLISIFLKKYINILQIAYRNRLQNNEDYTPVQWNIYFTDRQDVKVNSDSFRVYTVGSDGPLLVLLHGGGFSALTWCLFAVK